MATAKITFQISMRKYCFWPIVAILLIQQPIRLFGVKPWCPSFLFKMERVKNED